MNVIVEVQVAIDLNDEDLLDPYSEDPLSDRMVASAREAVLNALIRGFENGFEYDMDGIAHIAIDGISAKRIDENEVK
jgi:hypothetical protein